MLHKPMLRLQRHTKGLTNQVCLPCPAAKHALSPLLQIALHLSYNQPHASHTSAKGHALVMGSRQLKLTLPFPALNQCAYEHALVVQINPHTAALLFSFHQSCSAHGFALLPDFVSMLSRHCTKQSASAVGSLAVCGKTSFSHRCSSCHAAACSAVGKGEGAGNAGERGVPGYKKGVYLGRHRSVTAVKYSSRHPHSANQLFMQQHRKQLLRNHI